MRDRFKKFFDAHETEIIGVIAGIASGLVTGAVVAYLNGIRDVEGWHEGDGIIHIAVTKRSGESTIWDRDLKTEGIM